MKIPTILQCHHFILQCGNNITERIVKDYEFDYYLKGERKMYIDDVYYPIYKGSLILRKPGQKVRSCGDYDCYLLTLDFSDRLIPKYYDRNRGNEIQPSYFSYMFDYIPTVFSPKHSEDYLDILERLSLFSYPYSSNELAAKELVFEFLHLIISDAIENKRNGYTPQNAATIACQYMKENYMNNLTLDKLASLVHLNKNYFARLFKQEIGITPNNYLIHLRLENAKVLLIETDFSIQSIAYNCGYNNPSFFNYYFKKQFHITPIEYRHIFKKSI